MFLLYSNPHFTMIKIDFIRDDEIYNFMVKLQKILLKESQK